MKLTATIHVMAKNQKPWKADDGTTRTSYSANIFQDNGEIIDTIKLTQEQFNVIEANKSYNVTTLYGVGKNGGYLKFLDFTPTKAPN